MAKVWGNAAVPPDFKSAPDMLPKIEAYVPLVMIEQYSHGGSVVGAFSFSHSPCWIDNP